MDHILVKINIRCIFQHFPPGCSKQHPITLSPGTPHCGTFGPVQHSELDHGFVRHNTAISTHGINFPHNLPFRNPAHCRITAHLGNGLHVHGNQKHLGPHIGGSSSGFTAGMTSTNNYDIVF